MREVVKKITRRLLRVEACPGRCQGGVRPDGSRCMRCAGSGVYFRPS